MHGKTAILLLCGGDKRNQAKDIERAHGYWKDYKARERTVPRGGPS
jgi:putative component of toxin-antitoxin plasmid stabilization module